MRRPRVLFITGKGGVGKTTIAAALGLHLAGERRRTLIVETDQGGRLSSLFDGAPLSAEPAEIAPHLFAVRLQSRALLEEYFESVLRLSFLAKRLLSSRTFNALTSAAPGVTEFVLLQKLLHWVEPGWSKRSRFDAVLVDGPASDHALKLLGAPRAIASLVPGGPIGRVARDALKLLADHRRTSAVIVSLPEELAVAETLETHDALANDLAVRVERPVLNRVFPRRFSPSEIEALAATGGEHHPLVAAAHFQLAKRRETERHMARLRRALETPPLALPMLFNDKLDAGDLTRLGASLGALA